MWTVFIDTACTRHNINITHLHSSIAGTYNTECKTHVRVSINIVIIRVTHTEKWKPIRTFVISVGSKQIKIQRFSLTERRLDADGLQESNIFHPSHKLVTLI